MAGCTAVHSRRVAVGVTRRKWEQVGSAETKAVASVPRPVTELSRSL